MSLFEELKRRNVFRVAAAYVVLSWVLLQIGDILFDFLDVPDWAGKMLVAFLVLGFIPAIVFSWAFELTSEGIKRESEIDRSRSIVGQTGRKLEYVTIGMIVLGIGFALYNHFVLQPSRPAVTAMVEEVALDTPPAIDSNTIAVLPFTDLSPDGDQAYFAQGIAEEILNVLAGIDGLEVASRTSSFQFAGQELGIPEIADELKVRHVLEGSLRKAGSTLRITAQLIDAQNDRHLWSETYDRPLTAENVFQVQDEISTAIVAELSEQLSLQLDPDVVVEAVTANLDAYELYLRARQLFLARERLDDVDELLARATELDPEFAEAWEIRAPVQVLSVNYGFVPYSEVRAQYDRGRRFAERALALDADSATALATLALLERDDAVSGNKRLDIPAHLAKFDRALEIEPRNGSALLWRGLSYTLLGYLEKALADFENCVRFEPLYSACNTNYQFMLSNLKREREAMEHFLASLDKGIPAIMLAVLPMVARQGDESMFKIITNGSEMLAGWRRHDDLYTAFRNPGGNHDELRQQLTEFFDERGTRNRAGRDLLLGPLGTTETIQTEVIVWDPLLESYRASASFKQQMKNLGVVDHWREHGFPAMCRPVGSDDFACD